MIKIKGELYEEINDYAKLKGVTVQTVYNWIKNKQVEVKPLMGKKLIKL